MSDEFFATSLSPSPGVSAAPAPTFGASSIAPVPSVTDPVILGTSSPDFSAYSSPGLTDSALSLVTPPYVAPEVPAAPAPSSAVENLTAELAAGVKVENLVDVPVAPAPGGAEALAAVPPVQQAAPLSPAQQNWFQKSVLGVGSVLEGLGVPGIGENRSLGTLEVPKLTSSSGAVSPQALLDKPALAADGIGAVIPPDVVSRLTASQRQSVEALIASEAAALQALAPTEADAKAAVLSASSAAFDKKVSDFTEAASLSEARINRHLSGLGVVPGTSGSPASVAAADPKVSGFARAAGFENLTQGSRFVADGVAAAVAKATPVELTGNPLFRNESTNGVEKGVSPAAAKILATVPSGTKVYLDADIRSAAGEYYDANVLEIEKAGDVSRDKFIDSVVAAANPYGAAGAAVDRINQDTSKLGSDLALARTNAAQVETLRSGMKSARPVVDNLGPAAKLYVTPMIAPMNSTLDSLDRQAATLIDDLNAGRIDDASFKTQFRALESQFNSTQESIAATMSSVTNPNVLYGSGTFVKENAFGDTVYQWGPIITALAGVGAFTMPLITELYLRPKQRKEDREYMESWYREKSEIDYDYWSRQLGQQTAANKELIAAEGAADGYSGAAPTGNTNTSLYTR